VRKDEKEVFGEEGVWAGARLVLPLRDVMTQGDYTRGVQWEDSQGYDSSWVLITEET
jgi:hypothetical protein